MRALAFGLATVIGLLLLATVVRATDVLVGPPEADRTGTATVTDCTTYGPVGRWGVGTSHECRADVRWDDGVTGTVTFPPGQLAPGERDVAVFDSGRSPGANDSARWTLAGPVLSIALGLLTVWFAAATIGLLIPRRPRDQRPDRRRDKPDERWPVTKAEVARAPVPRRVRRLRLIAWLGLGAGALEVLASLPLFDAPRRVGPFVSPWPELESAWLVDPPSGVITGFGALVAVIAGLVASSVHTDVARIVRYGQPYVDSRRVRPASAGRWSWVPVAVLAALGVLAVVSAVGALPADAPAAVALAAGRDAILLFSLVAVVLATRQSAREMATEVLRNSWEPEIR
ncbi:hypothetical protein BLA60_02235 [Actinophytocola xinjiangensis]|uniref:SdpI/YhfL family protein n=1 Tax=Actinophytocola xinjiangensis TaxID=485602 RepID=A0A7Z1B0Q5_9PSEU|nr:DUF6346 domain-containing protein [Actinophytocola xinjiangensis]OLF14018.1 hypothetical protein BLA60_02235 [Actinophytocola xinjiangensis]